MNRLLDKNEVSEFLQVSVRTVDRLRRRGQLQSLKVGDCVRFREEDVRAYLDAQQREGRA
jgi:excisionase family DNA binding protein